MGAWVDLEKGGPLYNGKSTVCSVDRLDFSVDRLDLNLDSSLLAHTLNRFIHLSPQFLHLLNQSTIPISKVWQGLNNSILHIAPYTSQEQAGLMHCSQ